MRPEGRVDKREEECEQKMRRQKVRQSFIQHSTIGRQRKPSRGSWMENYCLTYPSMFAPYGHPLKIKLEMVVLVNLSEQPCTY